MNKSNCRRKFDDVCDWGTFNLNGCDTHWFYGSLWNPSKKKVTISIHCRFFLIILLFRSVLDVTESPRVSFQPCHSNRESLSDHSIIETARL